MYWFSVATVEAWHIGDDSASLMWADVVSVGEGICYKNCDVNLRYTGRASCGMEIIFANGGCGGRNTGKVA